jgi:hypothetical protein
MVNSLPNSKIRWKIEENRQQYKRKASIFLL